MLKDKMRCFNFEKCYYF